jgi:hypothetical protein
MSIGDHGWIGVGARAEFAVGVDVGSEPTPYGERLTNAGGVPGLGDSGVSVKVVNNATVGTIKAPTSNSDPQGDIIAVSVALTDQG